MKRDVRQDECRTLRGVETCLWNIPGMESVQTRHDFRSLIQLERSGVRYSDYVLTVTTKSQLSQTVHEPCDPSEVRPDDGYHPARYVARRISTSTIHPEPNGNGKLTSFHRRETLDRAHRVWETHDVAKDVARDSRHYRV